MQTLRELCLEPFSSEEIDAMVEYMNTGRDRALPGRLDQLRALGLIGPNSNGINSRGNTLRQHVFDAQRVTREDEDAVCRFEMLKPDSIDRTAIEAELLRLGLGYRCRDGSVILNGWGHEVDDRWRIANK